MLAEAIPPPDKQNIRLLTIFFGMHAFIAFQLE
jgi:hypothetical protein